MNWLEPVTLQGSHVQLEALTREHAPGIFQHYEQHAMTYLPSGQEITTLEQFTAYIGKALESKERAYWAIRMRQSGALAGFALITEAKPHDNWLALGTLIMPTFWGGVANAETKLLLMTHAFETLGVHRVQFTVDSRNERSMRALEKLGATREAVLRKYDVRAAPAPLDIAMYSVLDDEWPTVKHHLQSRLEQFVKENP